MRLVLVSERFLAFVQVEISENINWRNENDEDAINSDKVISYSFLKTFLNYLLI